MSTTDAADVTASDVTDSNGQVSDRTGIDDDLVIERRIELGLDAAELWDLVATPEGWRRWLVDGGNVDVRDGGIGRVADGDVDRDVRIGTVDHGRSVSFTWWERDEPSTESVVHISITEGENGRVGLSIIERIPAARFAAVAALTMASSSDALFDQVRFAWEVRACVAWAGTRSIVRV